MVICSDVLFKKRYVLEWEVILDIFFFLFRYFSNVKCDPWPSGILLRTRKDLVIYFSKTFIQSDSHPLAFWHIHSRLKSEKSSLFASKKDKINILKKIWRVWLCRGLLSEKHFVSLQKVHPLIFTHITLQNLLYFMHKI